MKIYITPLSSTKSKEISAPMQEVDFEEEAVSISHRNIKEFFIGNTLKVDNKQKKIKQLYELSVAVVLSALFHGLVSQFGSKILRLGNNSYISIMGYFFIIICTFLTMYLLIDAVKSIVKMVPWCGLFIEMFLIDHDWKVMVFLSLFIASLYDSLFFKSTSVVNPSISFVEGSVSKKVFTVIDFLVSKGRMSFGVFLCKYLLISFLQYYTYKTHYSERMEESDRKMRAINRLLEIVGNIEEEAGDVSLICTKLMHMISKNGKNITYRYLKEYIRETEIVDDIFEFAGVSRNDTIEIEELKFFFVDSVAEKEHITKSIKLSNASVKTLNSLGSIICIFIIGSKILNNIELLNNSGNNQGAQKTSVIAVASGFIISGGYIFSDIFKSFLISIIFVFFKRPFEIGDFIQVSDKIYKVKEVNIMSSILLDGQLKVDFPNSELNNMPVTNFRMSDAWEVPYTFVFDAQAFKNARKTLLEALMTITSRCPKKYKGIPYYRDVGIVSERKISVTLVIGYNLKSKSFGSIIKAQEAFVVQLDDILHQMNLLS